LIVPCIAFSANSANVAPVRTTHDRNFNPRQLTAASAGVAAASSGRRAATGDLIEPF
jgi:hypothetical protein